jgi:hypothetical protein
MNQSLFEYIAELEHAEITCPTCHGQGTIDRTLAPSVGRYHPETSQQAARAPSNRLKFGSQRHTVLLLLQTYGDQTAAEIADRIGMSRNQIATRLGECRKLEWVSYVIDNTGHPKTRKTSSDSEGCVQTLTTAGRQKLAELNGS